jgi:hypothetical protein
LIDGVCGVECGVRGVGWWGGGVEGSGGGGAWWWGGGEVVCGGRVWERRVDMKLLEDRMGKQHSNHGIQQVTHAPLLSHSLTIPSKH